MGTAPLINGRRYSYSSIEYTLQAGVFAGTVIDIDEISYSEQLDIAFRNGTSKIPLGSTAGVWQPQECTLSMGKSTFTQFMALVGPGWLGSNLLLMANYNDEGEPLTSDLITSRITGHSNEHSYGPDPLKVTLKFMTVIPIISNGVPSVL